MPVKHGIRKHPVYAVWNVMRQRCQNSNNKQYADYGGRGIAVDPRWNDFIEFWKDMGPTYVTGLSLDRKNNDGPYNAENCRWVSMKVQQRNRRDSRTIETPQGPMLLCEAVDVSGIHHCTLLWRIRSGWSTSRMFDPVREMRR